MYTYLTMQAGDRVGQSFLLPADGESSIGRDPDCDLALTDPQCSRIHAVVRFDPDGWLLRDQSRNGTFVDGRRIEEARLREGCTIRIGATEFSFHQSPQPPTIADVLGPSAIDDIVMSAGVHGHDSSEQVAPLFRDSEPAQDLVRLYQCLLRLVRLSSRYEMLQTALQALKERTRASTVAFWRRVEGDEFRPQLQWGEAGEGRLGRTLTQLLIGERRAVWLASQRARDGAPRGADALYVPVVAENCVLGALQAQVQAGRFRQLEFEFAISLANALAGALSRATHLPEFGRLAGSPEAGVVAGCDIEPDVLIGDSPALQELQVQLRQLAVTSRWVLLQGERGVGKRVIAQQLHRWSSRAAAPMATISCLDSAVDEWPRVLQGCDGGTLLLRDIEALAGDRQEQLVTLLSDRAEGRGQNAPSMESASARGDLVVRNYDVRIVATAHDDLARRVREGVFRGDLYLRLEGRLVIPPLRRRLGDVERLIDHFLAYFRQRHGRPDLEIAQEARNRLARYHWPGNVGQLRNVIDTAVATAPDGGIGLLDLSLPGEVEAELPSLEWSAWERRLIVEALRRTEGSVPEAARLTGLGRATLYRKIEEYGIRRSD